MLAPQEKSAFCCHRQHLKSLPDSAKRHLAQGAQGRQACVRQKLEINVLKMCHLWDLARWAEFNKDGRHSASKWNIINSKCTVGIVKYRNLTPAAKPSQSDASSAPWFRNDFISLNPIDLSLVSMVSTEGRQILHHRKRFTHGLFLSLNLVCFVWLVKSEMTECTRL